MRNVIVKTAAALVIVAASMTAAEAMPMQLDSRVDAPALVLVSGGCGPYAHRGPYGGCQPGGGWGGPGWRGGWGGPGWRGGWHRGGWHGGWHRGWRR